MVEDSHRPTAPTASQILQVVGLITLALSMLGFIHQYYLLREFGVGLSDYADLDDFLVAAINLAAIPDKFYSIVGYIGGFSIIALLVITTVIFALQWSKTQAPRRAMQAATNFLVALTTFPKLPLVVVWLFVVLFLMGAGAITQGLASVQAGDIRAGLGCRVSVNVGFLSASLEQVNPDAQLLLITGLNSAYFFYERVGSDGGVTHIVPTSKITSIKYIDCQ
ncbi:hypothetical protein JCM19232_1471 [Vibrio ishigakensis]|uniref:Uncharacterized protein n=1 Tax=Vibrio ishigakensis TaxID=1481914 RepID=A0A0B8PKU3_9VIBR|nr:hypothetical protein JCM19232_1471 [Vibrio ishigakensis]